MLPVIRSVVARDGWTLEFTGERVGPPAGFHPLADAWADIVAVEGALHVAPGTPILLRPDGEPDYRVTAFFTRSLEFDRLATTAKATYATELKNWLNFLHAVGEIEWDEATGDWFRRYRMWRLVARENPSRVTPATFAKCVPALRMFYEWAVDEGYALEIPLPKRLSAHSTGGVPKDRRATRDRWVMPETYAMWRNVGLRNRMAEFSDASAVVATRTTSPGTRDRNQLRNVAFTDLALTTALRNREVAHLLWSELPSSASADAFLPGTLAKGGRERGWSILTPQPFRNVDLYLRTVRRAHVAAGRRSGVYERPGWIVVSGAGVEAGQVVLPGGEVLDVGLFSVEERARLLIETDGGPEPMMVWLTETGVPMDASSWNNVFRKANGRVASEYRRLGVRSAPPRLSAHSLRSTCALFTLVSYVRAIDERLGIDPAEPWVEATYTEAFDHVRELLGHADVATTKQAYLKPVRDFRRMKVLDRSRSLTDMMEWLATESAHVYDPRVDV